MKKFTNSLLTLLTMLAVGVNLHAQTPFWSEDFAGSIPADWTAIMTAGNGTPSSNWVWTNTGPAGGFSIGPLASATANNGWMLFDSDLNCSGEQDATLLSPKLDLTNKNQVYLRFQTFFRRFNDQTTLVVSTDSINWTEITLFDGVTNTEYGDGTTSGGLNPQIVTVNISANAANKPQFWFGFRFLADSTTVEAGTDIGCGYSWQIDDVQLFDANPIPAINLAIGDYFYPPASYAQPVSQIKNDTMGFFADLSNIGAATVNNVVLKAEVRKGGTVLFVDSLLIPALDTSVTDSTFVLENQFVPDMLTVGNNYSVRYSVYSLDGTDQDMADNTRSENFEVTDALYSKEAAATIAYRPGGDPADWAIGNVYQTSKNWVDHYKATKATFQVVVNAADGPLAGKSVAIALVQVDDNLVDSDWNGFDDTAPYTDNGTLIIKSIDFYDFTQSGNNATVSIDLTDFELEQPSVVLEEGKRYILLANYQGAENIVMFHAFSEAISYFQISTVVFTDQWFLGGFGPEPAAVLRMQIDLYSTSDEVSLPDNSLSFYPNPANRDLNVDINLEEPTLANITLADLNGRVILIDEVENAYKETRNYDVSSLANGTYIVRIATKSGTKTKKFVVQH